MNWGGGEEFGASLAGPHDLIAFNFRHQVESTLFLPTSYFLHFPQLRIFNDPLDESLTTYLYITPVLVLSHIRSFVHSFLS